MRRFILLPRLLAALILMSAVATSQTDILTTRNLFDIRQVLETAISPDGRYIAYTVFAPRPFTDQAGPDYRDLMVYDIQQGVSRNFLSNKRAVYSLGWTHDGAAVTYIGVQEDGGRTQVFSMSMSGGEPVAVTASPTGILGYSFSPDGKQIAYIATDAPPAALAELRRKGYDAQVYEELNPERGLHVRELATGTTRKISNDVAVFDIQWSPDGSRIAAAVAPENTVDMSYMFKRIHLFDPASGTMTLLVENPGKLGKLAWSPDGSKLAFIAAVAVWDSKEGSIFVIDRAAPKPFKQLRNYSAGFEGTVIDIAWKDNNSLLFTSEEGVDITLRELSLESGNNTVLIEGGRVVFGGISHHSSLISFAASTPAHPRELYTWQNGNLTRRTVSNDWLRNIRLARQERFVYKAKDGLEITGILIYPLDYTAGKTYPLIVDIHGGPEAAYQNGWVTNYGNWGQVAAAKGYFVFMPNYRASTGRGVEYLKMGLGDLVGKEFTDVLDGIDRLIDMKLVDSKRVGMGGGSYGGYFSAWAATKHSKRFAAAVVFVGVSNQISKRNTTDIPYEDYYVHWTIWTHEDFQKVYDRSPVKWTLGSTTPTLILHGTEDSRVHPSQGLELYRSLKIHGKAPVRLVWYQGEGHGNRRNTNRLDYMVRTMDWFDTYLQGSGKEMPAAIPTYPLEK
jgi:dipeptidyl aminopeptidase/acylaminoacyl peptidase